MSAVFDCRHGRALYVVPEIHGRPVISRALRCCRDCGAIDMGRGYGPPLGEADLAEIDHETSALGFARTPADVIDYFGSAGRAWKAAWQSRDVGGAIQGYRVTGQRTVLLGLPELPEVFVQRVEAPGGWGRFIRSSDGTAWSVSVHRSKAAAVAGGSDA